MNYLGLQMNNFEGSCSQTDPEIFFPEPGRIDLVKLAKKVCANCVELEPCREDALTNTEQFGIRGGLTPKERKELRNGK